MPGRWTVELIQYLRKKVIVREGQSDYVVPEPLTQPEVLDLLRPTTDLTSAQKDLRNLGCCIVTDVLSSAEVADLQARLGLKTYGTLGNVNGSCAPNQRVAFGSVDVALPEYRIGENAKLIPMAPSEASSADPRSSRLKTTNL